MVPDRRSGSKDVGSYALHVDCPWYWTTKWGDVLADNESDHAEVSALPLLPVTPRAVEVQDDGSFSMTFDDDSHLSVEPDPAPDVEEYWRLFEPHLETRHFVVGPSGVEA